MVYPAILALWVSLRIEQHLLSPNHFPGLTPVHFFSHGSTRMLEAETESGEYWEKCGQEALAHGVKGIILMVSLTLLEYRMHHLLSTLS